MGVSVFMRPGSIMRSMGEPVNITPGMRSQFVSVLEEQFGHCPMELHQDDGYRLGIMAAAASVYASSDKNAWQMLSDALAEHGVVTVTAEY